MVFVILKKWLTRVGYDNFFEGKVLEQLGE
jgi:hypothetical protein